MQPRFRAPAVSRSSRTSASQSRCSELPPHHLRRSSSPPPPASPGSPRPGRRRPGALRTRLRLSAAPGAGSRPSWPRAGSEKPFGPSSSADASRTPAATLPGTRELRPESLELRKDARRSRSDRVGMEWRLAPFQIDFKYELPLILLPISFPTLLILHQTV